MEPLLCAELRAASSGDKQKPAIEKKRFESKLPVGAGLVAAPATMALLLE